MQFSQTPRRFNRKLFANISLFQYFVAIRGSILLSQHCSMHSRHREKAAFLRNPIISKTKIELLCNLEVYQITNDY